MISMGQIALRVAVSPRRGFSLRREPWSPVAAVGIRQLRQMRDGFFEEGRLEPAIRAAEELAGRDPGRESFLRLGFLLREKGRYRQALKVFRDALRFQDGPRYLLPEIHIHIAHTWFLLRNRKRMLEALRRAEGLRPGPRSDGKFNIVYGNDLFRLGRYREALERYENAERFAKKALDRGRAVMNQGLALARLGELEEAGERAARSVRIFKSEGLKAEMAEARMALAAVRFDQGLPRRAMGIMLRAAVLLYSCGKKDRQGEALAYAGYAANAIGLWGKGRDLLDRAVSLSSAVGRRDLQVRAHACRALARAHLGELDGAKEDLALASGFLRGRRDWVGTLHLCRARAGVEALLGDWAAARRAARLGERAASRAGDIMRVAEFRRLRAQAEENLGRRRASGHARKTAAGLEELVGGRSQAVREAERRACKLAAAEFPILVVGECPAWRLRIARLIHREGRHRRGPFVVAPCEQMVFPVAEIAGHVRGAWTGADRESPGMARKARGGTFVLDRLDELPAEAQKALVSIVEGKVRAVGAVDEEILNARVVATCRDISKVITSLQERFSGGVLRLPSLNGRRRDIAGIVEETLRGRREITPDALVELARRPWDGDLAELRAAVERLVVLSDRVIGRRLVRRALMTTESCRLAPRVDKKRRSRRMAPATA